MIWCVQIFFREEKKKGRSYADLYELVQHAGNVLPRLCAPLKWKLHACMCLCVEGRVKLEACVWGRACACMCMIVCILHA